MVWQRAVAARPQKESRGYLIRDRDQVYGERFSRQARMLDIQEAVIVPRSNGPNTGRGGGRGRQIFVAAATKSVELRSFSWRRATKLTAS